MWPIWELSIINQIQNLGDWLEPFMHFFSTLGIEYFYLLVLPAIMWCYDVALGFRVGTILVTSSGLNNILKMVFSLPRPYWVSTEVQAHAFETSFALPSGHSQNAMSIWGRIAVDQRKRWLTILMALTILGIGFSRLYLGVHFLSDVLSGFLTGAILLFVLVRAEQPFLTWLRKFQLPTRTVVLFALSLLFIGAGFLTERITTTPLPIEWLSNAAEQGQTEAIDPYNIEGLISSAALLFGLGVGGSLFAKWGDFRITGYWWQLMLRYLVGIIGVAVLYIGLKMFSAENEFLHQSLRYLRYASIGIWVAYLAPRLFIRMKLFHD